MQRAASRATISDRSLNRLIVAFAAVLVIGVLAFTAFYLSDRFIPHGTDVVDRQTAMLEAAVRQQPNNVNARLQLAGAYTAGKRYQDAIGQFNTVLTMQPNYKSALLGRGEAYQLQGTLDKAAADFQAVIDIARGGEFAAEDTELTQAYYSLGAVDLALGKPAAAITPLLAALANNKTDSDTLDLLGQAYTATGQTANAIEALRAAVSFVPTGWADPYTTLAKAYSNAGQPEEAAWANAMAMLANKQIDQAIASLKGLTSGPAAIDAKIGMGLALELSNDPQGAADWYRQALAARPSDLIAQGGLSRVAPKPSGGESAPPSLTVPSPTAPGSN